MKRKITSFVLVFMMLLTCLSFSTTNVKAETSQQIKVGDYIQFGKYYDEPILWRCVDIDENGPLMLSDRILTIKAFDAAGNHKYLDGTNQPDSNSLRRFMGSNLWETSSIRAWLNSAESEGNVVWLDGCKPTADNLANGYNNYATEKGFLAEGNFTEAERNVIKSVKQKSILNHLDVSKLSEGGTAYHTENWDINSVVENYDTAYYNYVTDKIFLVDVKQLNRLYQNINILGYNYYIGIPTQKAVDNSEYKGSSLSANWYFQDWTRTPSTAEENSCNVRTTSDNGVIYESSAFDSKKGVRPAFYLDMNSAYFETGDGRNINPFIVTGKDNPSNSIPVTSVEMLEKEITMYQYDYKNISYAIEPYNASNQDVTFEAVDNSQNAIHLVSDTIFADKPGTAKVIVTTKDGNKQDYCTIKVLALPDIQSKWVNGNIQVTLNEGEAHLSHITYDTTTLNEGSQYTKVDNVITINKDFISQISAGVHSIIFDFVFTKNDLTQYTKRLNVEVDNYNPIITIDDYIKTPTSQPIVVTASTNVGNLNATSHTFRDNGSFDFIAIDEYGNVTTKTVTISNIAQQSFASNSDFLGYTYKSGVWMVTSYPPDYRTQSGHDNATKYYDKIIYITKEDLSLLANDAVQSYLDKVIKGEIVSMSETQFLRATFPAAIPYIEGFNRLNDLTELYEAVNDYLEDKEAIDKGVGLKIYHYVTYSDIGLESWGTQSEYWSDYAIWNPSLHNGVFKSIDNLDELEEALKNMKEYVVHCPVSVGVYDTNNNLVAALTDDSPAEQHFEFGDLYLSEENGEKVKKAYIKDDSYKVSIYGTGTGSMNYSILALNNGKVEKKYSFVNVPITNTTIINANEINQLLIVNDGDDNNPVIMNPNIEEFDIVPPEITIGDYVRTPTNKDITVTASTNEGTLNTTSHVFTENGNFDFVATDATGNISRSTVTITNIDKTLPVVTLSEPSDNAIYILNQKVVANWNAMDSESGIANVTSIFNNGEPIDTSSVGTKSFTVTATDKASNQTTKTITYKVIYGYGGILQPLNSDGSSTFKVGSTIPVKFQLKDANNANVTDAIATASIFYAKANNGTPSNNIPGISKGESNNSNAFRYDETSNQFIFDLSTTGWSAGTYLLTIKLNDGTSYNVKITSK